MVLRWKKKAINKIGDKVLVQQLVQDYSPQKFTIKFIIVILAFTLAVIALANPRRQNGSANINRSGIDVMIALDVSKSMLAQDIKPDRISRARQFISRLIDKLSNDRIGIVVFAGRAYLQMPLTTDHAAAKMYLSSATPDVVPTQGTVIGDALKMCYAAFNSKEKKYKSIVLISDGEDHDESAVKITKALADEGVMVNTVGIGSPEGTLIPDAATGEYKKDAAGSPVITKLNEAALKDIADKGEGLYQLFTSADEVAAGIEKQLQGMGQRAITENSMLTYKNYFSWFVAAALLLIIMEFFIAEKTKRKNKVANKINKKSVVAVSCLLFLLPLVLKAQTAEVLIKKGNEAYAKKEYGPAADNYKKVIAKNPANEKAQYNLGNALYKDGKPDDAVQAYDAAIANGTVLLEKSGAWYNKGVVLQNNKKLPECIEAYKNALRINPNDEDARLNLQKALMGKKKQQQNKQQQQKQKDKSQQSQPQSSKMTKKEAEEKLKALLQQEKNLQDKLRKVDVASPQKPEKDW